MKSSRPTTWKKLPRSTCHQGISSGVVLMQDAQQSKLKLPSIANDADKLLYVDDCVAILLATILSTAYTIYTASELLPMYIMHNGVLCAKLLPFFFMLLTLERPTLLRGKMSCLAVSVGVSY